MALNGGEQEREKKIRELRDGLLFCQETHVAECCREWPSC